VSAKTGKKKEKPKKPSFAARMAERGREAKRLGVTLRDEPKAFPAQILELVRRSVRTIWDARGGGFYACGFVVTFVWLEIRMLFEDIVEAQSVGDFFTEQLWEMFFRYFSESFINGFLALIWPVYVIEYRAPWGFALLLGMYLVFAGFLKAPLERWLFRNPPG
jgi:hypothetical protein